MNVRDQELYEFAMYLKSVSDIHRSWTIEQILRKFDWYRSRGCCLFVRSAKGVALILVRFIFDLEEGIKDDVHFPPGPIVWIDYFAGNCNKAICKLICECISRWKPKQMLAFHKYEKTENLLIHEITPLGALRIWRYFDYKINGKS